MAISKDFAMRQAERFESFEGFPRMEFQPTPFGEYVNALMRSNSEQQCREVVTHFVETATKYPSVAVVLSQIRITTPPPVYSSKKCQYCVEGWRHVNVLVESPGAKPVDLSPQEAAELMERIASTRNSRSMIYSAVRRCGCTPVPVTPVPPQKESRRSFKDFAPKKDTA